MGILEHVLQHVIKVCILTKSLYIALNLNIKIMQILKRGAYKKKNVDIDCENCKSKLRLDIGDIHRNSYSTYFFCAVCGCSIDITEEQIRILQANLQL